MTQKTEIKNKNKCKFLGENAYLFYKSLNAATAA